MTNSEGASVRPMTDDEYRAWSDGAVRSYGEDIARSSGMDEQLALERARREFGEMLPGGLDTDGTHLLTVLDGDGAAVGTLWLGPRPQQPDMLYVYDIGIDEQHRGRGLGRAAMQCAEQVAREVGATSIGLNVFGFNEAARRLYDSLGYEVVATQMRKRLG